MARQSELSKRQDMTSTNKDQENGPVLVSHQCFLSPFSIIIAQFPQLPQSLPTLQNYPFAHCSVTQKVHFFQAYSIFKDYFYFLFILFLNKLLLLFILNPLSLTCIHALCTGCGHCKQRLKGSFLPAQHQHCYSLGDFLVEVERVWCSPEDLFLPSH